MPRSAVCLIAALAYLGLIFYLGGHGSIGWGGYPFMAAYVLAHGALAALWFLWPRQRPCFAGLMLLALLARAFMFPFPCSDDVNRYLWEGKIQEAGHSPYVLAPDAEELVPLRDDNWQGINHKDYPTIYPPAAQLTFRLGYWLWPDRRGLRLIFSLFELGTLLVLFGLARCYALETRHLLLYALNPLVLVYSAGEGHLDPTAVFFVMAALLAWKRQRQGLAFFLLGMGVMFKILPLIFLPLLIQRQNWKKAFLFLVPFVLCLPYLEGGMGMVDTPARFATTFYYNAFLFSILQPWLSDAVATAVCWSVFSLLAMGIFFLVPNLFRACYLLIGALLLCMPVMHQWYFLLLAPFLPFFRSWAWLGLFVALAATFVTRIHQMETGGWFDSPLARCIEYGVFILLWAWGVVRGRVTGPQNFSAPRSVSVVIPVLNEADGIADCIASVQTQDRPPEEILVVDGGSEDATRERVRALPGVELLESEPGRGVQIARGVARAKGDVVLVLHGDSRLLPDACSRMLSLLREQPAAVGGAFGHRYLRGSWRTAFIGWLDNSRARWLGLSFGNQGQFFRRDALPEGFPALRLMEDVELTFRMKKAGALLYLPRGVANFPRRWQGRGYLAKIRLVLSLVGWFILARRLGRITGDCDRFYKRYYPA